MSPPARGHRRRGPALCLAAIAVAGLALAACQTRGPYRMPDERAGATPPAAPSAPAEQQARRPAPETAPVPVHPDELVGLAERQLDARLGPPSLVRAEASVRIWQYRGARCVLDLVLYPAGDGREVVHLEARDAETAAPFEAGRCLALLRRERGGAALTG